VSVPYSSCRVRERGGLRSGTWNQARRLARKLDPTITRVSCGLRVAGCGLRVAGCGLRVAGCGLRVAGFYTMLCVRI
jgi:hypothetical protein